MRYFLSCGTILATLAVAQPTEANAQEVSAADVKVSRSPAGTTVAAKPGQKSIESVAGPSAPAPLSEVSTDDAFASVGRGFDPATGRILDIVCVEGTESDHGLGGGTLSKVSMQIVSDEKSYSGSSGSSFGFSAVIKAVSLGFGTSSASANSFNSVEQFARIYARIATVGVERRNVRWSKQASHLLQTDLQGFLTQCGTRYVRGVYSGHLLDESVHFHLDQKSAASSDATSLSIGVAKLFSASAAFSDADASFKQLESVTLTSYGRGALALPTLPGPAPTNPQGGGDPAPQNPPANPPADPAKPGPGAPADPTSSAGSSSSASAGGAAKLLSPLATVISYYNGGFSAAVTAAPKLTAVPLYIVTDRYRDKLGLISVSKIPAWADDLMAAVVAKSENYDDVVTALSDLKYALAPGAVLHLSAFYKDTDAEARQKLVNAKALLTAFRGAVAGCQKLLIDAKEIVPDPSKPGSTASATVVCQRGLDGSLDDVKVAGVKLQRAFAAAP